MRKGDSKWLEFDERRTQLEYEIGRTSFASEKALALGKVFELWNRLLGTKDPASWVQCWHQAAELLKHSELRLSIIAWITMVAIQLPKEGRPYMSEAFLDRIPEEPIDIDMLRWVWGFRRDLELRWLIELTYANLPEEMEKHQKLLGI